MSYDTQDQSVHDSEPIECYLFTGPSFVKGYNDSEEDVTVNGQLYHSLYGIDRDTIETGVSIGAERSVTVGVPFDCDVALEFGYLASPDFLNVTIIRIERGTDYDTDYKQIWAGVAQGFSTSGLLVNITTVSDSQIGITRQVLTIYWQRTCNFELYDGDTCKANKTANTVVATVTAIGDTAVTVNDDGFADGALAIGEILNTRTNEKRLIVNNLANVVSFTYGFSDIVVGDTVNLIRGCKHTSEDCNDTFADIANYGGYRFIPRSSPIGN